VDECRRLADVCWNHIFQRITVCTGCLGNLNTRCNHTDWRRPVFSGMGDGDYRYSESISLFGTTSGAGRRPAWLFEFAESVPTRYTDGTGYFPPCRTFPQNKKTKPIRGFG